MRYFIGVLLLIALSCSPRTIKDARKGDIVNPEIIDQEADTTRQIEVVTEEPDNERKIELILEFQRTSCFGKCPVFVVRGFSDGRLIYHGKSNVDRVGYYESFLSTDARTTIFRVAEDIDFFRLADNYPVQGPPISDLPKTKTFLKNKELEKKIVNQYDAPAALLEFEKFLDELLLGMDWTKVNGD